CEAAGCGDGVKDTGETCDMGAMNSDTTAGACRTDCTFAVCGDGVRVSGEQCDDGSANSDTAVDACRDDCLLPRCGDRVVDTGEFCDDGPFNSDDEPMRCRVDCQSANGPLDLHGGACDVPTHPGGEWPLGVFVLVAVAVLVPLRRRGL
ncbi:MAG: hypothetical protein KC668_24840, partial [Myxococcales bacterium]|nr:hypothetical protein [Myxococcales bacterium]